MTQTFPWSQTPDDHGINGKSQGALIQTRGAGVYPSLLSTLLRRDQWNSPRPPDALRFYSQFICFGTWLPKTNRSRQVSMLQSLTESHDFTHLSQDSNTDNVSSNRNRYHWVFFGFSWAHRALALASPPWKADKSRNSTHPGFISAVQLGCGCMSSADRRWESQQCLHCC